MKQSSRSWDIWIWQNRKTKQIMGKAHARTWTTNYSSFIQFLRWFYNKIQKISSKGQAVLDMLQFKEPCNLIGWYRFKPLMRNQKRPEHAVFTQMSPIRVSNLTKKSEWNFVPDLRKNTKNLHFYHFWHFFQNLRFWP